MAEGVTDRAFLERVVGQSDLNVLRLALYQATGDPELAAMDVDAIPLRGGAFFGYVLAEHERSLMIRKAVEMLAGDTLPTTVRIPDAEEIATLMTMFTGTRPAEHDLRMGVEELAFEDFPRAAVWSAERPAHASEYSVAIIGAGASGLGAAIQFERLGIDYRIFDRQSAVGGTWNLNHYPDARVDTSSFLYQFRFEKNHPWSEYFAGQAEVRRYLEGVAKKYGVYDKISLSTEVTKAEFNESTAMWELTALGPDGTAHATANFVVAASGLFSTPKYPNIPGLNDFQGEIFHTAQWDDAFDPAGKRIAVIGNGSTGVQIMPALAKTAEHVYAFQRTPQWISPMLRYREPISTDQRWLFENVPGYWNWYCYSAQVTTSGMQGAQEYDRAWQAMGGLIGERNDRLRATLTEYIASKVPDPELQAELVPDYAPLARRLVVDNGWYDALARSNVDLVTDGIVRITDSAIETVSGRIHEVDAIVAAAGFDVEKYLWPMEYVGRGGVSMEQRWQAEGPRAYLGMTVPDFPNLFVFYGPNSAPRAGSVMSWVEMWSRYCACAVIDVIERGDHQIEVTQPAFDRYNDALDEANKQLIWELEGPRGGRNYYVNRLGRQIVQAPWLNGEYALMLARPNPADYRYS